MGQVVSSWSAELTAGIYDVCRVRASKRKVDVLILIASVRFGMTSRIINLNESFNLRDTDLHKSYSDKSNETYIISS